jgi:hypothetical protein
MIIKCVKLLMSKKNHKRYAIILNMTKLKQKINKIYIKTNLTILHQKLLKIK